MAVALRGNREGEKANNQFAQFHATHPKHRVGFLGQNPPAPWPHAATRRAKGRAEGESPRMRPKGRGLGRGSRDRETGGGRRPGSRPGGTAQCGLSASTVSHGRARAASPRGLHLPLLGSTRRQRQGAPGTTWCRLRRRRRRRRHRPPAGAAPERTTRAAGVARPSRLQPGAALGPWPPACAQRASALTRLRSCASPAPASAWDLRRRAHR